MLENIIDSTTSRGYEWFDGSGTGYLRSLLRVPKSYEKLLNILENDLLLANEKAEVNSNFGELIPYIEEAIREVSKQIEIKTKTKSEEENLIGREMKDLEIDFKKGLVTKDEYDFAIQMLNKKRDDDLSYLKNKFEEIDSRFKNDEDEDEFSKELDKVEEIPNENELKGIEDERYKGKMDYDSFDQVDKIENREYFENKNPRFWSFNEYDQIYEDMINQKQQQIQKNKQKTPQEKQLDIKGQQLRQQKINDIIQKNKKAGKNMNPKDLEDFTDEELDGLVNS